MSEGGDKYKVLEPSIGGDVADLFGNLRGLETGVQYHNSLNPDGDPFAGVHDPRDMVNRFVSAHPDALDILSERLDSFYEVTADTNTRNLPKEYTETKAAIELARIRKAK